jgi:predicted acetylornithine/succinylornithine family transaminase
MSPVETLTAPAWAGTLAARGASALVPAYARYPIELAAGRGARVVDSAGKVYLDFVAGIAVNALGHGHPAVVEAIRAAADGLLHVSNLYWTEPMVRLAERLARAAGMERAFFCNSGTEAVETALKLARAARPGRAKVVVFERSFHGRTLGALSATMQPQYQEPFRPLLPGIAAVPFGDLDAAASAVDRETAAVLVEPIQGEGGVRPAPPGFLGGLRRLCDRAGALLLLDEVQCGLGRTGTFLAYQGEGVLPDAVACAKALAGGLPMGAVLARGPAAEALGPGLHGCTFGGGPLVAAAAHAVLDVILAGGFLDEVRLKGEHLGAALDDLAGRHVAATGARGRGLLRGIVLRGDHAPDLVSALHDLGLLTVPAGKDVLRLLPPLVVTHAEIDEAASLLDRALRELSSRAGRAAPA